MKLYKDGYQLVMENVVGHVGRTINVNSRWTCMEEVGDRITIMNARTDQGFTSHIGLIRDQDLNPLSIEEIRALVSSRDVVAPPPVVIDEFPQDNAASEADLDSVGSFTSFGITFGVNSVDTAGSVYSISGETYAPSGNDYFSIICPGMVIGQNYRMEFDTKFIPGGLPNPYAEASSWIGCVVDPTIRLDGDLDWTFHSYDFEASTTNLTARWFVTKDTHDSTGDVLLLDHVKLFKI